MEKRADTTDKKTLVDSSEPTDLRECISLIDSKSGITIELLSSRFSVDALMDMAIAKLLFLQNQSEDKTSTTYYD